MNPQKKREERERKERGKREERERKERGKREEERGNIEREREKMRKRGKHPIAESKLLRGQDSRDKQKYIFGRSFLQEKRVFWTRILAISLNKQLVCFDAEPRQTNY